MKVQLSAPELALIAATRGALGAGIGLLLAPRLGTIPRRALGFTLLAVGAFSTIPLAIHVLGKDRVAPSSQAHEDDFVPSM